MPIFQFFRVLGLFLNCFLCIASYFALVFRVFLSKFFLFTVTQNIFRMSFSLTGNLTVKLKNKEDGNGR